MLVRLSVKSFFFIVFCIVATHTLANKKLTENYISTYKQIAIKEMKRTGIPASIKLAQGILESDLGRSPLANQANNHFGIKCGKDWSGNTYFKHDDETGSDGSTIESCFRAYSDAEESYIAHSEFLTLPSKQSRYGFLFELKTTDYAGWANGLKFSGYATDPFYPTKLIKIIENYQLYKMDENIEIPKMKSDDFLAEIVKKNENPFAEKKPETESEELNNSKNSSAVHVIKNKITSVKYKLQKINRLNVVYAYGGESISELAFRVDKNVFDLLEYNEGINSQDAILETNEIVFLEKKKKSYQEEENAFHIVLPDETLYQIAQKYGVRLESLLAKNNLMPDDIPIMGEIISLHINISKKDTPKHKKAEKYDDYVNLGSLK